MWGGRKAAEQEQVIVGREAWLMEVGGEGGEAKGQRKSGLREGRFEEAGSLEEELGGRKEVMVKGSWGWVRMVEVCEG